MEQLAAYGIVGLSTAAIYAIVSSGLVLTYATTGVFNFAHGATGMLAAFSYWQLTVGWGWPVPVALILVLAVLAPAYGLLVERFALRPVQGLGDAERLVVTVALLSGSIALSRWVWDPNVPRPLATFFVERQPFHIGPAVVTWHQATTMAIAVVVAAALWGLLHHTRTGTEMRATVDDPALVGLAGADPVRASRVAWVLSTQLAAVGGILVAPLIAVDAVQLSLLIVNAYTAAVFGRLRSLPLTFVGAVVLGCLESYLAGYLPQDQYLSGLRLAAPAVLLLASLLMFPHRQIRHRVRRTVQVPTPSPRGTAAFAAAVVGLGVVMSTVLGDADLVTYGALFPLGIVALSFVPLTGYAGQISLCQLSMAGIGAAVWGHVGAGGHLWALGVAIAVPALVGALIALPALRLSGIYLALATAAFAVVLDRWLFGLPPIEVLGRRLELYHGGAVDVTAPRVLGLDLADLPTMTVVAASCLALVSVGVALLRRARFGRRLIALRDSEAAYATLGGDVLVAKVLVFALSAGVAGLGGVVLGMQQRTVTAEQFSLVAGLPVFLVAVVAGVGAVGSGLFTGLALAGPLNAAAAAVPGLQNAVALMPGLAGVGLGRHPAGLVPSMRHGGRRAVAQARSAAPAVPEIPVEWWGVRRDWRPGDEEVLNRAIARG